MFVYLSLDLSVPCLYVKDYVGVNVVFPSHIESLRIDRQFVAGDTLIQCIIVDSPS